MLFLALWLAFGLAINSNNLEAFDLQQAGPEAMVEQHHLYLETIPDQHVKHALVQGDCFSYNGHVYAAKQPGQFMAGAVIYFFLHMLGLSYVKNYLLVSALVTFFTASLATAVAGVAVFRLAQDLDGQHSSRWALLTALVFGLATTAFPYSGIAHHDVLAASYLTIAFYLIFSLSHHHSSQRLGLLKATLAGLFLGLTISTSMLPFFMAAVVGVYFLSLQRWKLLLPLVTGGIMGTLPSLVYNAIIFGNPLLLPNIGGNKSRYAAGGDFSDTFFRLDWDNFLNKIDFYTKSITWYVPVLWLGLLGLYFLRPERSRERFFLFALVAVLAAYILNIGTVGGCLYGPRYLLPALPFVCVGLVGLRQISLDKQFKVPAAVGVALVCLFSFAVNLVGAVRTAMFCDLSKYGFTQYLPALLKGEPGSFPLVPWLIPIVVVVCLLPTLIIDQSVVAIKRPSEHSAKEGSTSSDRSRIPRSERAN